MRNPQYYRLFKGEHFVGFKRVVTEYLPVTINRWQLASIDHNPEETQMLCQPAMGIAKLAREKLGGKKPKAKKEEPQAQNETEDKSPVASESELKF